MKIGFLIPSLQIPAIAWLPRCALALAALALGIAARAAELSAANAAELATALASAKPGDTVYLEAGTWSDAEIKLTTAGTTEAPLTLRARKGGEVILNGASSLTFAAPYVVVDGLCFKQGALTSGQIVRFDSDHCRLTNTAFVNYNPADMKTKYYWVYFAGNHNRVDHCFFTGKNHLQPLIGNEIKGSRYNTVDNCYLKDIPYLSPNGREDFRIWGYGGNEDTGDDGAYFTIERNLFERAHGEGMEIISLKSNRNRILHNTIRGTRGGLTLRSGNFNTLDGNFIFGDGAEGAYGIRVTGQFHTIVNNYISDCTFGINLYAGEFIDQDLTGSYKPILREGTPLGRVPAYSWPRNDLIAHNTLVNNREADFIIGGAYKAGWPRAQRVLLPAGNRILNNLVVKTDGGVIIEGVTQDKAPPLDRFTFDANVYAGNIAFGGTVKLAAAAGGFKLTDPKLVRGSDGVYRPADGSPALDAGIAPAADNQPLTADDVGPDWVKAKRQAGDPHFK